MLVRLTDLFLAVVEIPGCCGVAELPNQHFTDAPTPAVKFEVVAIECEIQLVPSLDQVIVIP